MKINLLDLFSGIGGFAEGLSQAGFDIQDHHFSEIDKHAIAIYKQNFKEANYAGSVTDIRASDLPRINAITFGSPCQDFSLAGKRAGLEGQRSGLIGEAIRLIRELRPDFFIWENVKGVYSSNAGADYWAVKQAFANLDGYRLESQLLNTAWLLPQNRERIYLVGRLREGSGRSVFPIRQEFIGSNEGSVKAANARCLTAGGNSGGMHSSMSLVRATTIHGKEIARWSENKDGIRAFRDDAKKSSCSEHYYHKPGGTGKALTVAHQHKIIDAKDSIRRLTEIECERLQGFAENWTELGNYDGDIKKVSATQRYKCLGNAVTVPVVKVVGESLLEVIR